MNALKYNINLKKHIHFLKLKFFTFMMKMLILHLKDMQGEDAHVKMIHSFDSPVTSVYNVFSRIVGIT